MDRKPLTTKQGQVMDFIRRHIAEKHYAPSLSEIGNGLGFGKIRAAQHVRRLIALGYVARTPNTARTLTIVEPR